MGEKTHPDDVMKMMVTVAKDHGYCLTSIDFIGLGVEAPTMAHHSYSLEPTSVRTLGGANHLFI